ncbi:xanthine dehydrogenase family protein molybdopterin-binding subunit [Pseudosporangium ferrugineum]|uniref:Xanthine dehydrogenase molybdenum binding subunit apoprotein n=1 Tax=Pseudosporangium ferrugineum TaxID=439699 RepID=A0A2T0SEG9_9ACTN|nr:xanthine dehydrogenase family protein molybdopterin-binding subunit [Pseudosporangium ferrugineum]PRY31816.1 xanthine dehydrogenase molybdenum binding subunit apoprotein [Pseudosporangium ferrugineum]
MSDAHDAKLVEEGAALARRPGRTTTPVPAVPENWAGVAHADPLSRGHRGYVGTPLARLDGPVKVRGRAPFAAEYGYDDLAYAALAYSTIPKGRMTGLDTAAAEASPGVVLVLTHRNAPRLNPQPGYDMSLRDPGIGFERLPVMQDDRVHWNGQPIALVLAETQEQADHAASLIHATYAAEPAVTSFAAALAAGTRPLEIFGRRIRVELGDAEQALAASAVSVDETYRTPPHHHNTIEPHAVTVAWHGDELRVHDSTQGVLHTAWTLGQILGIDPARIRVTSPFVGGGFGVKVLWQHHVLAAVASRTAGRPVRLALSREGVFRMTGGRPPAEQRVAVGADEDGRIRAIVHTGAYATTRHSPWPEPLSMASQNHYASDAFVLDTSMAYADLVQNCSMRTPGSTIGFFALESAVDELAGKLGMDPIELRLRNETATNPIGGKPFSSRHAAEAWRAGAERFGWSRRSPVPGSVRDGEWLAGMGCAMVSHHYQRRPGGAARIRLTADGRARAEVAAHEMGMGTATVQSQILADRLGLDIDRVSVGYGDSAMPGRFLAVGSSQSAGIGGALLAATRNLMDELLKLVRDGSPLAGLTLAEVGAVNGGLAALDDPSRHESYESVLARAGRAELVVEGSGEPPAEMANVSMFSFGAIFCEVRVSSVTGETRVSRILGSIDCGRVLNPRTAASQFRGGIVMGLGAALTEETVFDDRNGRIVNASLGDYHVPAHLDVPPIDLIWTDIPDPYAPAGARGIGELSSTGVAPAVANAIHNATGRRIRDLPITPEKLL